MNNKRSNIIELYGLPGCGKSTLRDSLVKITDVNQKKFCIQSEMTKAILNNNILFILLRIPYKTFWFLLQVILMLPKTKKISVYRKLFMHAYCYHQANFVNGYDYIVMDHGLIQSLIGILSGKEYKFNNRELVCIKKLLDSIPHITYVNCKISTRKSLDRIRKRGRDYGRLDVIKEDSILEEKLLLQKKQFEQIYSSISNNCNRSICIDMEQSIDTITSQIISNIDKLQ